jgi:hypothetical protein
MAKAGLTAAHLTGRFPDRRIPSTQLFPYAAVPPNGADAVAIQQRVLLM